MARIALDAMGGDLAPLETVIGAGEAAATGVDVVLVGDSEVIGRILDEQGIELPVVDAPEVITMDEPPSGAIRRKKRASVTVAARMVADGEATGMVSAGSTGAALAAAAIIIGRVAGVSRPAIATIIPIDSPVVFLDAGANLDVRAKHLAQFAVMGSVMARVYLGLEEPRVGLLNIGEESGKGRDIEKDAYMTLEAAPVNFVGNVEGRDLGGGRVDVIVTDGFTGNVVLKTVEATARIVGSLVADALSSPSEQQVQDAAAVVLPHLIAARQKLDPEAYGGAHLLGVRGTVVIAHGSSSRLAIANALRMAAEGAEQGLVEMIEEEIARG
jgi:glycerol-3-phosphate acyltransferase PlsX